jgi:hypothetical protein
MHQTQSFTGWNGTSWVRCGFREIQHTKICIALKDVVPWHNTMPLVCIWELNCWQIINRFVPHEPHCSLWNREVVHEDNNFPVNL